MTEYIGKWIYKPHDCTSSRKRNPFLDRFNKAGNPQKIYQFCHQGCEQQGPIAISSRVNVSHSHLRKISGCTRLSYSFTSLRSVWVTPYQWTTSLSLRGTDIAVFSEECLVHLPTTLDGTLTKHQKGANDALMSSPLILDCPVTCKLTTEANSSWI